MKGRTTHETQNSRTIAVRSKQERGVDRNEKRTTVMVGGLEVKVQAPPYKTPLTRGTS